MNNILKSIEYNRNLARIYHVGSENWLRGMRNAAEFTKVWRTANTLRAVSK